VAGLLDFGRNMMKANSIIFTLVLVSGNCVGFAPGHQLYPHEKWGLDFDVLSSYSETTKSYDIVVSISDPNIFLAVCASSA